MNWKKIVEQVVTIVLTMLVTAVGTAIALGMSMLFQHERELSRKDARIEILENELKLSKDRDKELVTLVAEEIKVLQESVESACQQLKKEEDAKEPETSSWFGMPKPKKPTAAEKLFQDKKNYERVLRDKFEQRIQQHQMEQRMAP